MTDRLDAASLSYKPPMKSHPTTKRRCILVLGMHRSGTSALTRTLSLLGAALPRELLPASTDNPAGFWEGAAFKQFNDDVFRAAGMRWEDPGSLPAGFFEGPIARQFADRLPGLIAAGTPAEPLLVLKDPRLCRLMPLWRPVLEAAGYDLGVVLAIRNPAAVAASLLTRDGAAIESSLVLWLRYVLEAEAATRDLPRSVVQYDRFLVDWRSAIDRITAGLSIAWPERAPATEAAIDAFLDRGLRHHSERGLDAAGPLVDDWVRPVFEAFGGDVIPTAELDRIRAEIERSASLTGLANQAFATWSARRRYMNDTAEWQRDVLEAKARLADAELANMKLGESARATIEAIYRSTSWRLTRPVRHVRQRIDRLRARTPPPPPEAAAQTLPALQRLAAIRERDAGWVREVIVASGLFDAAFYRNAYPEASGNDATLLDDYLAHGLARQPNAFFDAGFYLAHRPEIAARSPHPLADYVLHGARERLDPHPVFDTVFYLERVPDAANPATTPLGHFLRHGATAAFDPAPSALPHPFQGVCIVTPDIVGPVKNGGIGTACYHYAHTLAAAGQAVTIVYTGELSAGRRNHWRNDYRRMRINFLAMEDLPEAEIETSGMAWHERRSWRVYRWLLGTEFRAVHFQDWHGNGFWTMAAKRTLGQFAQTRISVILHSSTRWINQGMRLYPSRPLEAARLMWSEEYAIRHADCVISPSRHMLDWLDRNEVTTAPERHLLPYCFTDQPKLAKEPGVDLDHLVFFGRLETRKGLHILGDALREIGRRKGASPLRVSFLGKIGEVAGMPSDAYVAELGRELPYIRMQVHHDLDYRAALAFIQDQRALVVIPSILDNLPLTVIEAINNRIPFLASTAGGIPEMTDPRALFEPTPDSLADLLERRATIDFEGLMHPYSSEAAAAGWVEFHEQPVSRKPSIDFYDDLVSVCIPFFNHERYLAALLAAFAEQSHETIELILINDGSRANASDEFDRLATLHGGDRRRFVTTPNSGPGTARNRAAAEARGDYLVFFDADNVPKPHLVRTLLAAIRRTGADCITAPYAAVEPSLGAPGETGVYRGYFPIGACLDLAPFENVLGDSCMIVRRSVFERLGGFPTERDSWEDYEFLFQLCLSGFTLEVVPEVLYYYRVSPAGRRLSSDEYLNRRSLLRVLPGATPATLARVIRDVALPLAEKE